MYTLVTLYNNNGKTIQQWVTDDVVTLSNGIIVFKPLTADRNLRQVRLSGGTLVVETFNELPKNVEIK